MSATAPDLTRAISFRGFDLNTVSLSGGRLVGCQVDSFDLSQLEVRQFTEPLALAQGLDVGGVWLGARHVAITGTVYDITRGKAFDRLASLEAAMSPIGAFAGDPTSFGYAALAWYSLTASGTVTHSLNCRPDGLRYVMQRKMFGGHDTDGLAIPWSVALLAKTPTIA